MISPLSPNMPIEAAIKALGVHLSKDGRLKGIIENFASPEYSLFGVPSFRQLYTAAIQGGIAQLASRGNWELPYMTPELKNYFIKALGGTLMPPREDEVALGSFADAASVFSSGDFLPAMREMTFSRIRSTPSTPFETGDLITQLVPLAEFPAFWNNTFSKVKDDRSAAKFSDPSLRLANSIMQSKAHYFIPLLKQGVPVFTILRHVMWDKAPMAQAEAIAIATGKWPIYGAEVEATDKGRFAKMFAAGDRLSMAAIVPVNKGFWDWSQDFTVPAAPLSLTDTLIELRTAWEASDADYFSTFPYQKLYDKAMASQQASVETAIASPTSDMVANDPIVQLTQFEDVVNSIEPGTSPLADQPFSTDLTGLDVNGAAVSFIKPKNK